MKPTCVHQPMANIHSNDGAVMRLKSLDCFSTFHVPKANESVSRGRIKLFAIRIGCHGRYGSRVTFQCLKIRTLQNDEKKVLGHYTEMTGSPWRAL